MDKYEFRRQQLIKIRDEQCNGKAVNVARKIGREPSYVSRMLYPEGKKGKKRIADDMVELIEESFGLPRGWMDGITSSVNIHTNYETRTLTPRQRIFLDLLDELPESEADKLLKTLEEKKQYYNMIYEEIRKKKAQNAS
ncbi:putative phage repressor protein CI [Escherichia coli]|uniref:hypothetical protein n=1 Tax=Escherichia coli TaxID=562 RepID=UPI001917F5C8|nr:hypothetical protein [Escherichia coli]EFN7975699.1 hypothetical protein [Escherichia coli]UMS68077.1 hypothetical protein AOY72_15135 [Escherichia coli]CAD6111721.1 putative phage repressor protein CI [Escherichia coli]